MQNRRYSDLVTFTEEILKLKLYFFVQCMHPVVSHSDQNKHCAPTSTFFLVTLFGVEFCLSLAYLTAAPT